MLNGLRCTRQWRRQAARSVSKAKTSFLLSTFLGTNPGTAPNRGVACGSRAIGSLLRQHQARIQYSQARRALGGQCLSGTSDRPVSEIEVGLWHFCDDSIKIAPASRIEARLAGGGR